MKIHSIRSLFFLFSFVEMRFRGVRFPQIFHYLFSLVALHIFHTPKLLLILPMMYHHFCVFSHFFPLPPQFPFLFLLTLLLTSSVVMLTVLDFIFHRTYAMVLRVPLLSEFFAWFVCHFFPCLSSLFTISLSLQPCPSPTFYSPSLPLSRSRFCRPRMGYENQGSSSRTVRSHKHNRQRHLSGIGASSYYRYPIFLIFSAT